MNTTTENDENFNCYKSINGSNESYSRVAQKTAGNYKNNVYENRNGYTPKKNYTRPIPRDHYVRKSRPNSIKSQSFQNYENIINNLSKSDNIGKTQNEFGKNESKIAIKPSNCASLNLNEYNNYNSNNNMEFPLRGNFCSDDSPMNVVIVGDSKCGKTSLILSFIGSNDFHLSGQIISTYSKKIELVNSRKKIESVFWDLPGDKDFDRLRPLAYADASVCLCCFAINSVESLNSVVERWIPELAVYCPNIPIVLVGLQADLRHVSLEKNNNNRNNSVNKLNNVLIPYETCLNVSNESSIRNVELYIECSSITKDKIEYLFAKTFELAINYRNERNLHHQLDISATVPTTVAAQENPSKVLSTAAAKTALLSRPNSSSYSAIPTSTITSGNSGNNFNEIGSPGKSKSHSKSNSKTAATAMVTWPSTSNTNNSIHSSPTSAAVKKPTRPSRMNSMTSLRVDDRKYNRNEKCVIT